MVDVEVPSQETVFDLHTEPYLYAIFIDHIFTPFQVKLYEHGSPFFIMDSQTTDTAVTSGSVHSTYVYSDSAFLLTRLILSEIIVLQSAGVDGDIGTTTWATMVDKALL